MKMKILMNLNRLKTLKITPNQLVYLISLFNKQECYFSITQDEIDYLQTQGFLKETKEGTVLRAKTNNLMQELGISSVSDVEKLAEEYRALFPSGVKTYGYPVKGDKQECLKKLKSFKLKYNYSDEEILEATRVYLVNKKKDGYKGTQLAHYYIEKDGISNLATMCEELREKPDNNSQDGIGKTKGI